MNTESEPGRKPLLDGGGVVHPWSIAQATGVRQTDVERLIETAALPGALLDESGVAFGVTDEHMPTAELLLSLGAHLRDADDPEPEPRGGWLPDTSVPESSWRMEW